MDTLGNHRSTFAVEAMGTPTERFTGTFLRATVPDEVPEEGAAVEQEALSAQTEQAREAWNDVAVGTSSSHPAALNNEKHPPRAPVLTLPAPPQAEPLAAQVATSRSAASGKSARSGEAPWAKSPRTELAENAFQP